MRIHFFAWCFAYSLTSLTTCAQQHNQNKGNPAYGSDSQGSVLNYKKEVNSIYNGRNLNNHVQNGDLGKSYTDSRHNYTLESSPTIHNEVPYNMTEGEDATLICSVNVLAYNSHWGSNLHQHPHSDSYLSWEFQWTSPNRPSVKTQVNKHTDLKNSTWKFHATQTIHNLTQKDKGDYTCEVLNSDGKIKSTGTYFLHINELYLEVKRLDDSKNFVKTESESVEWTVRVNASPIAAVTWFNPNGEGINITFDNITEDGLKNRVISNYTGNITTLSIRNLSIDDSGIYQMRAFTPNHFRILRYNLTVNGTATIRMIQYFPYNTLVCDVSAYPLATISWYRESCSSENSSDCMIPEYRGKTFNKYKRVSIIQLKEDDDSKPFVCEATNSIGTVRKTRRFKFIKIRTYDEDAANSPGIILYLGLAIFAIIFGSIFVSLLAMILIQENKHGNNVPKKNRLSIFDTRVIRQLNPRIDIEEQAHLLPYDSKMEFPKEKLYLGRMIGKGAFGFIKKAVADNIGESTSPSTVAVKTIERNTNRLYVKLLASELKLLIYVGNHPNLVNLLGACTVDFDTKKEFSTIVEYCKHGNLRDFLLIHRNNFINQLKENDEIDFSITKNVKKHKLPNIIDMTQSKARKYNYPPDWRSYFKGDYRISNIKSITTNDLIRWSYQTTCGMDYLTGRKVLHSDLTARNLLLDENKMVKICNFGLAKNIYQKDDYREIKTILLPMKWMALESIKLRKFSTHSDVWSFGVTMWELFSLSEIPFPDINSLETLYEILTSGERLEKPPFASNELYSIMKDCWNPLETTRPSFKELGSKLSRILESNIRLSSTRNETRELKMTDLIQNIHLQDKINTSHQDILLQMASVNLSTSNSSDLNCSSIEMKPRNSRIEQKPEE